ncbi:MAG: PAS domain S-box protein [Betaproteobacteria bacterium]|nr:PAS domain S-box protein [Betaproteobacteria bacterium]
MRVFHTQWKLLSVFLAVLALVMGYNIHDSRRVKTAEERVHLSNLAAISADILERRLTGVDRLLQSMIDRVPAWAAAGDGWQGANIQLSQLANLGHGTDILMIAGPDGRVLSSNHSELIGQNFAHRYYFHAARDARSGDTRVVSPPFQTVFGDYTFTISRKLLDNDGRFAGVVMATMDMPFIGQLLERTLYAADMWTALAHGNGIQIIMVPTRPGHAGKNLAVPGSFFSRHIATGNSDNTLTGVISATGEDHLMALRTIQPGGLQMDFPLIIAVGRDTNAMFATWRQRATIWLLTYLSIALIACLGLWWYQKGQRRDWETILRKQALVDTATDGIHVLDAEGKIVDANPAFLDMVGMLPTEIGRMEIDAIDVNRSWQHIRDEMARLGASGATLRLETRHRHRDGHLIDVEVSCRGLAIDGAFLIVASSRDISQRKLALEKLAQRELELKTIIDTEPECVKLLDAEGVLLLMNPAGLAMIDAESLDQVAGHPITELVVPEHREAFMELSRRVFMGISGTLEFEIIGLRGMRRWMETHAVPMRDTQGRITTLLAVTRDISRRKAAEKEVAKLHQAVEQSPEGICITDADGTIEYVNRAFMVSSGYDWGELIGRNPRLLSAGETPRKVYEEMWATLQSGGVWVGELVNRRKNGEIYVESEIISPVRQPDGRITDYLAIKQDITEKKLLQREVEAYREHLEELVESKTAALQEANASLAVSRDAANEAARSKAAFLSNMSHEIRTPMNGIIGMLHLLRRSGMDGWQRDCLTKIEHSANHLLALINDILDLSKIDAGKLLIEQLPISVPQIVANVSSIIGEMAHDKGLSITTDLAVITEPLLGDATRIAQALLNYASNAVKFTERGSIDIRTHVVESDESGVLLRFDVTDTGPGVAPEVLARLFQAFEQADNSTTRLYKGTGLGLAITRQLARLMGGDAGADSQLGQGSMFWFTVRLAHGGLAATKMDEHPAQHDAESLVRSRHAGARVLLVEDEPINQEISQLLLEEAGLHVDLVGNGEEAVRSVESLTYDLILMDMQMPVMDGLEATRRIRRLPHGEQVPILAMTANAFADDRERCFEVGMNDFVAKPVDPEVLFRKVLDNLEGKQAASRAAYSAGGSGQADPDGSSV